MLTRPNPVPATVIRSRLLAAGFQKPARGCDYERRHDRDPHYAVQVYVGDKIMRVIAVQQGLGEGGKGERDVSSSSYVDRYGEADAVLDKLIEAAREAYQAINRHRRGGK